MEVLLVNFPQWANDEQVKDHSYKLYYVLWRDPYDRLFVGQNDRIIPRFCIRGMSKRLKALIFHVQTDRFCDLHNPPLALPNVHSHILILFPVMFYSMFYMS